ncbi:TM0106 family RecB-like putative nuclease [Sphingomonas sp. UYP23]
MQKRNGATLFSASDLVNFMGCAHATFQDIGHLTHPASFPPDDEAAVLLQEKGIEHERAYLERLRLEGRSIVEIVGDMDVGEKARMTRAALWEGPDVIYQGAFLEGPWQGYSDFLLRVERPSRLGGWSYEVADTKLARTAKPKHLLQMCIYSDILAREQGATPEMMHVVLGDGGMASVRVDAVAHYFSFARERFLANAARPTLVSTGAPCGHCTFCRWATACDAEWEAANHLSIVAGMTRGQTEALVRAGVPDLVALAELGAAARIPGIQPGTLSKLRNQARLQAGQRATGVRTVELLDAEPGRGLARLPLPDEGDMFFDMEGDPLFDEGLEYLFGIVTARDGVERFDAFWAHDREGEKRAFQETIDFMTETLRRRPGAHIYHYAAYEETALKRLAMLHGTREAEVDDLLRNHKLVDLYRVVKEALRTSEPRYSIKNMEKFYLGKARGGEVKTAGDSIVIYERWRSLQTPQLLQDIEDYNRIDCSSTLACRDWLVGMRREDAPWYAYLPEAPGAGEAEERGEAEQRVAAMADALLAGDVAGEPWRQLLVDLLEFHRRESKPGWWAVFSRQDMQYEELLEDAECLAGLTAHPDIAPWADKRSMVHTFRFPAQDFKLKPGDKPKRAGSLEAAGDVVSIYEEALTIELKIGPSRSAIEEGTALIPAGPVGDRELRGAVYRFAEAIRDGDLARYPAVLSVLRRDLPALTGRAAGAPVIAEGQETLEGTIEALLALDGSHLLVQGPPGAGKTYTSSQSIVALLARGMRVGIASNGHKAINQLLREVEALAAAQCLEFRGVKKNSREDQMLGTGGWIEETMDNKAVGPHHQLVAGTAWLFARPEHDRAFDYLFVDEAGQVGLANIVAMGVAARNIVLVGDQMQLAQPIQGTHPRDSGVSALQHLLQDHATVPPARGVFLAETRRMHPDLCGFISAAVYEGRLRSAAGTEVQRLLADPADDPEAIASKGLRFVAVDSVNCTQRNAAEAARLDRTYRALLGRTWRDRHGVERPIGTDDILVVSPYNMQVELLRRTLPQGARVGTVDKFQGQEAAVVLISMATSSGDDLPRNIEFLYSRNRLNVAISRAKCLAVIYASPRLLEIPCHTIKQMELVNGLCWARNYALEQAAACAAPVGG